MTQDKAVDLAGLDSLSFGGGPDVEAFLSSALKDGLALADDGFAYESVQDAVDAASGWVFVGPGTFNESVTISTAGFLLNGAGDDSVIEGNIVITGADVTLSDIKLLDSGTDTIFFDGDSGTATRGKVQSVTIESPNTSSNDAIRVDGGDNYIITNCTINDHDYGANLSGVDGAIVSNCSIGVERGVDVRCVESQTSEFGGYMDDIIVANNVTYNAGNRCLQVEGDDGIWIGNRVSGSAKDGIGIFGIDNIVANNRVSDSANTDITNSGTGTVLDGNLTGASN